MMILQQNTKNHKPAAMLFQYPEKSTVSMQQLGINANLYQSGGGTKNEKE